MVTHENLVEMYDMLMQPFDGKRFTPFGINPMAPEFGAKADGTDDAGPINEAILFARWQGMNTAVRAAIWLPQGKKFSVGSPIIWHYQTEFKARAASLKALPSFDFTTLFPSVMGPIPQAIVEGWNLGNKGKPGMTTMERARGSVGRYFAEGLEIDGASQPGSNGMFAGMQQPTHMSDIRFSDCRRIGFQVWGQDGYFENFMVVSTAGPVAETDEAIGVQLGIIDPSDSQNGQANYYVFDHFNAEQCFTAVKSVNASAGANAFYDCHFENNILWLDDPARPAVTYDIHKGNLVIGGQQWLDKSRAESVFIRVPATATLEQCSYRLVGGVFRTGTESSPNDGWFLRDYPRNRHIKLWGETRKSKMNPPEYGIARRMEEFIAPDMGDSGHPRNFKEWIGPDGQRIAFSFAGVNTQPGDEFPTVSVDAGSTQFGDLWRLQSKNTTQAFRIDCEALAYPPAFPAIADFPAASTKEGAMAYALDAHKLCVSDGTSWIALN